MTLHGLVLLSMPPAIYERVGLPRVSPPQRESNVLNASCARAEWWPHKSVHSLIPKSLNTLLVMTKWTLKMQLNSGSSKGEIILDYRGRNNVITGPYMRAEGVSESEKEMWWQQSVEGCGPRAKKRGQPLKAGKGKKWILSLSLKNRM